MKAELVDVNDTRKNLTVEIPSDVVDAEIDRVAKSYSRKARIPGFRPGKAPARIIKQRFKDQILHDVAHDLIPRAVGDVLRERGVEAVDAPDIRDVTVEEGRPLTFTASFDTLPPFDPGDYSTLSLTRASSRVEESAVDQALQRLRERSARYEPVEGRGVDHGDTATVDLARRDTDGTSHSHPDVNVELGASANPPGFDEQLLGLEPGAVKTFTIHYPADHTVAELANTDITYTLTLKAIKRRVVPPLDDEFAKDLGDFATLDALRARVREDLVREAHQSSERALRTALMKQLAARVPFELPASMVERELDQRVEDFVRRLVEQGIDPRQTGVDWREFRENQREAARDLVAGTLVLDEVARREGIEVPDADLDREVERYAADVGRTVTAVRAKLEQDGGLSRLRVGLRREKCVDFLLARATIAEESLSPSHDQFSQT